MNSQQVTLDTFFDYAQVVAPGSRQLATLEPALPTSRVQEAVKESNKNLAPLVSSAALIGAIGGLLKIPLPEIITRAWNEGKLFEKYLDPEQYDPDELISITLKKHEVVSSHRPKIDVIFNGNTIDSIDFQLDVSLILDGIILQIRDGRVCEIKSGRIKGKATMKCENLILFKRETEAMDLPGLWKFPEEHSDRH